MGEKKKIITKEQYLQLLGIYILGIEAAKRIRDLEEATANILDLDGKDYSEKGGYIFSDNVWEMDIKSFENHLKEVVDIEENKE